MVGLEKFFIGQLFRQTNCIEIVSSDYSVCQQLVNHIEVSLADRELIVSLQYGGVEHLAKVFLFVQALLLLFIQETRRLLSLERGVKLEAPFAFEDIVVEVYLGCRLVRIPSFKCSATLYA